jgi:hypothetical protein
MQGKDALGKAAPREVTEQQENETEAPDSLLAASIVDYKFIH